MIYNKDTFLNYIENSSVLTFVKDLRATKDDKSKSSPFLFECDLLFAGDKIPVRIFIPRKFPLALPKVILPTFDHLGFIPHIEPNGSVCFLEQESVYINIDEPETVFHASIELVIQTLTDGTTGTNRIDFREEFNAFWERNDFKSSLSLISFIEIAEEPKVIKVLRNNKTTIIYDENWNTERVKKVLFNGRSAHEKSGLFIPLELSDKIIPPNYNQKWTSAEFSNWLQPLISEDNWNFVMENILNKRPNRFEYVILGIPRSTGPTLLIGVHLKPKGNQLHPLLNEDSDWNLSYLNIHRLEANASMPRGGANLNLRNKKILIVGCGSVGSHLVDMLVKLGVGSLKLIDPDILKMDNVQRFTVGHEYVGKRKVDALKTFYEKNYLNCKIEVVKNSIEDLILSSEFDSDEYDLIISTTGDPTINLYLNQYISLLTKSKPFVVGWNEPLGIGGHAIISVPGQTGCYRCLFREQHNISSFAAKNQPKPFHVKHLGCGEVYTPYAAIDSIRTAEMIARAVNHYFNDSSMQSQLISWKGDSKEFIDAGFIVSDRYKNQTTEEMHDLRFDFVNKDCEICKNNE